MDWISPDILGNSKTVITLIPLLIGLHKFSALWQLNSKESKRKEERKRESMGPEIDREINPRTFSGQVKYYYWIMQSRFDKNKDQDDWV